MEEKHLDIEYWKENAEEEYLMTPIAVLRYISELEKALELKMKRSMNKQENLAERAREYAMSWWNGLEKSQKHQLIAKYSSFLFSKHRNPDSLTGREIEFLNRKEETSLMDKLIRGDRVSVKSTGILNKIRLRNNNS
jgi:hypothetical protein